MKAISPLISAVIVIAIVFALAVLVSPWMFGITRDITNQTASTTETHLRCQNAAFDFDSGYGSHGVSWNFTGADMIEAMITNTGGINLYDFSFEAVIQTTSGLEIRELSINETAQKTKADPLKPGRAVLLKANMTGEDFSGTLKELKVLNTVCPTVSVSQNI